MNNQLESKENILESKEKPAFSPQQIKILKILKICENPSKADSAQEEDFGEIITRDSDIKLEDTDIRNILIAFAENKINDEDRLTIITMVRAKQDVPKIYFDDLGKFDTKVDDIVKSLLDYIKTKTGANFIGDTDLEKLEYLLDLFKDPNTLETFLKESNVGQDMKERLLTSVYGKRLDYSRAFEALEKTGKEKYGKFAVTREEMKKVKDIK